MLREHGIPSRLLLHAAGGTHEGGSRRPPVQDVKSTSQAKGRLMRRLEGGEDLSRPIPSDSHPAGQEKLTFRRQLLARESGLGGSVRPEKAKYLLQALRTLADSELDRDFVAVEIRTLYDRFYGREHAQLTYELRHAICFLDAAWHAPARDQ